MTTKITVDAHAGWPVEVQEIDLDKDGLVISSRMTIVQPKTIQDFAVWDNRKLSIKELKKETL